MFFFCLGTIQLVLLFGATAGILKKKTRQRMLQLGSAMLILIGLSTTQNNLALTGVTLPWAGFRDELYLPAFDQQIKLEAGTATISFMPEEPGVYIPAGWECCKIPLLLPLIKDAERR